jgi:hypothetical protein
MYALGRAERLERIFPFDDGEVLDGHDGVRAEGRAARLATAGAVAIDGRAEVAADFVPDGAAKTAAGVHVELLWRMVLAFGRWLVRECRRQLPGATARAGTVVVALILTP